MKNFFFIYSMFLAAVFLSQPREAYAQRKTFKSPPVYALGGQVAADSAATVKNDSGTSQAAMSLVMNTLGIVGRRDTLLLQKIDSLPARIENSAAARPTDSPMLKELVGMRRDLRRVESYLQTAALTTRIGQLRYQEDSIRHRRAQLLAAYPMPKRDAQQLQLYELELDSLYAERQVLFALFPRTDTYPPPGIYAHSDRYQQDFPYTPDSSQRHDPTHRVDSFLRRVLPPRPGAATGQTAQPEAAMRPTAQADTPMRSMQANTAKPPMQQDTASRQMQQDTATAGPAPDDSATLSMQRHLKVSRDSVVLLQRRVGVIRDSANSYRRRADSLAALPPDTAVVAKKKPFYRRIFSRPETYNPAPAADPAANRTASRQAAQQAVQYSDQANALEARITDLQRRNDQLERDYDRLRGDERDRRPRISLGQPPIRVIARDDNSPLRSDREEIRLLRQELDAVRFELNAARSNAASTPAAGNGIAAQPADMASTAPRDSAQLNRISQELVTLQQKLDGLHQAAPMPTPATAGSAIPDIRHYPTVSLYFLSGAVTLPEDQLARLAPLAAAAGDSGKIRVSLQASTDGVGSKAGNEAVAAKRTAYVRSVLADRFGIDDSRLKVLDPVIRSGGTSRKSDALDRRVDVRLTL